MTDQAATPTGGAEVSSQESQAPASVNDRLKAHLFSEPEPDPGRSVAPQLNEANASERVEAEAPAEQQAEAKVEQPTEGAQEEAPLEAEFSTVDELAEALGWDLDKLLGLDVKTKIDGKEGKQRLRDLIKSHQLEGHLNQKLMTHAEEVKAFQTEKQNFLQTSQHKLHQLEAGVKIAQKLLEGEFAGVNWQELQNTDPLQFAQQYTAFQQRQAQINHVANLLGQERQQAQQAELQQQQSYLAEQMRLMETKIPEWNDQSRREKELAEIIPIAKDVYGISEEEIRSRTDHRELLVLRDAWQWQKLQKQKPAVVNKVKTAPKLLKPGSSQSKAAVNNLQLQASRARLKQTGKVSDAKPALKQLLFGN
jgi:hypothetical protein